MYVYIYMYVIYNIYLSIAALRLKFRRSKNGGSGMAPLRLYGTG